jgi:hypothetical protein
MAISDFMLERYRHGELSPEDMEAVEAALSSNDSLRRRLEKQDESDRELRLRYPVKKIFANSLSEKTHVIPFTRKKAIVIGLAAAVLAGILIPLLYFSLSKNLPRISSEGTPIASLPDGDRPKGLNISGAELSIYLKSDAEIQLPDQVVLGEGNTVQLAYTAPAGTEHYGVIFSIDGRSIVTEHYPYAKGQSSLLVSGRKTFLDEAYTLDDAPDYEVFVLVVSEKPLDAENVLNKARNLARNIKKKDIISIKEKSMAVYEGCEVETVTVLKR